MVAFACGFDSRRAEQEPAERAGGDDRRSDSWRPGVDEWPPWGANAGSWTPVHLGDLVAIAPAVELDGPDLLLAWIALIGEIPEGLRVFIDARDGLHFIIAALDLVGEMGQAGEADYWG